MTTRNKAAPLSASEILALVSYDPNTGTFRWISPPLKSNRRPGDEAGWISTHGYRCIQLRGRNYYAHRIAWLLHHGEWPARYLDHKDGIKSNNQISNLRLATHSQNNHNKPAQANSLTGFSGVHLCKVTGRYRALIGVDRKRVHLGYFDTLEEATAAYSKASSETLGEFSRWA